MIHEIFLLLNLVNCEAFENSEIIFDRSDDVSVQCNPNNMCISIDEQYFLNNRGHMVRHFVKTLLFLH